MYTVLLILTQSVSRNKLVTKELVLKLEYNLVSLIKRAGSKDFPSNYWNLLPIVPHLLFPALFLMLEHTNY